MTDASSTPDGRPSDAERADPLLDALWSRALAAWDDERVHAAVLDHAIRTGALPEIAGRYRALAADPDKGALARERVDAVVLAATQMLLSTKTPPPGRVPLPITLTAIAACLVLLAWLALALRGR